MQISLYLLKRITPKNPRKITIYITKNSRTISNPFTTALSIQKTRY